MTSAIFYASDGFHVGKERVMGRQVAGNSFLKAYFKYTKYSEFWVYSNTNSQANEYAQFARSEGRKEKINFINYENTGALNKPGILFFPGPDIYLQAKNRSFFRNDAWSICGITHTTCSSRVIEAIQSLVTSPVYDWDAVICTSESAKSNVLKILKQEEENLKEKLNATNFIRPKFPVIPLGIDCSSFKFSREDKIIAKKEIGIKSDEIVILYVGRLSAHAKSNPFIMYKALEKLVEKTNKKIVLIECGWFGNKAIKDSFQQASNYLCPNVRILQLDGRNNDLKLKSFAAGDIFCSLVDNIQETFGITPIEAMASGLPVIVSDWDGYRETVRDGIDGYRIPTLMPNSGNGMDLSVRYALGIDDYDMHIGNVSNYISIDFEYLTDRFTKLLESDELRIKMGENAKERALKIYNWKVIIPQYEELWKELELRRIKSEKQKWKDRLDPFFAFDSYPSKLLSDECNIQLVESNIDLTMKKFEEIKKLKVINYSGYTLPDDKIIRAIISNLDSKISIGEIKSKLKGAKSIYLNRTLCWLNKFNIIKIIFINSFT